MAWLISKPWPGGPRSLDGFIPETDATQGVIDSDIKAEALSAAPPAELAEVDAYRQLRKQLFPNYQALNERYYALPKGDTRKAFLARFPELKEYWDWNKRYKSTHPSIEKYTTTYEESVAGAYDLSFVTEIDAVLARQLYAYYYSNKPLSSGAISELKRIWQVANYQGESFEGFIDKVVKSAFAPDQQ